MSNRLRRTVSAKGSKTNRTTPVKLGSRNNQAARVSRWVAVQQLRPRLLLLCIVQVRSLQDVGHRRFQVLRARIQLSRVLIDKFPQTQIRVRRCGQLGHHGIQIQFRRRRVTVGTIITLADFGKLDALTHKVTIETASASQVFRFAKLALAQPGTGERLFTFEADKEEKKAENSKKDADIIKNDVKNNNFTGLSAIIRGQADPGVLPQQHWEPAKPAAAPQQPAPSAAMQISTAPSVPRWKGSAQNEDMLDPFA